MLHNRSAGIHLRRAPSCLATHAANLPSNFRVHAPQGLPNATPHNLSRSLCRPTFGRAFDHVGDIAYLSHFYHFCSCEMWGACSTPTFLSSLGKVFIVVPPNGSSASAPIVFAARRGWFRVFDGTCSIAAVIPTDLQRGIRPD